VSDSDSPEDRATAESNQKVLLAQLAKLAPSGQKALFEKLIAQSQFYFALTGQLQKEPLDPPEQAKQVGSEKGWDVLQALFGGHSLFSQQTDIPLTTSPELSRLLGLPDIEGVKKQAKLFSELAKKAAQLQSAQKKLTPFFKELNKLALKQFSDRKSDSQDANELYSLWIECGEQAFAKVSQYNQYIESQTELLNSLTGMDALRKKVAQSALQQSGLSSHHEMETVQRSLHALKREFRRKSRQQEQEIAGLKKEILSLKRKQPSKSSLKK